MRVFQPIKTRVARSLNKRALVWRLGRRAAKGLFVRIALWQ